MNLFTDGQSKYVRSFIWKLYTISLELANERYGMKLLSYFHYCNFYGEYSPISYSLIVNISQMIKVLQMEYLSRDSIAIGFADHNNNFPSTESIKWNLTTLDRNESFEFIKWKIAFVGHDRPKFFDYNHHEMESHYVCFDHLEFKIWLQLLKHMSNRNRYRMPNQQLNWF